ncbi:MAG TPA: 1-(5-phosphoribosyl)-5-[(5-phosphoribosylamino)methylideneamino]imidazole-4-carboxamide isomerase [Thermomicrobiales bacterium]|jgi:phosphoribosylformimino-5-aminoimidazole carboxamide ribotide isomerase|nr:1-(5-phosphoribosyl)-5-[(5-phosphoribosylamino)methylideneamino]imidazole-4-carboxamide isomerase [Thermomicrobiales bacterium]
MIVYPSIDIRDGRCVRLVEGDFARETVYDDDPVRVAGRWAAAGTAWVHIVDLDGSLRKEPVNLEMVGRMREIVGPDVRLQLGGGLRTMEHLDRAFAAGADRAVLGSIAITDPALVATAVDRWGDRIAVGLDARDGMLAANGWVEQTSVRATDLAATMRDAGVRTFIFTDIARDGTLSGPNLEQLAGMAEALASGDAPETHLIASGGVAGIGDVDAVRQTGATGIIIGRALYDGRVDLAEALAVAAETEAGR